MSNKIDIRMQICPDTGRAKEITFACERNQSGGIRYITFEGYGEIVVGRDGKAYEASIPLPEGIDSFQSLTDETRSSLVGLMSELPNIISREGQMAVVHAVKLFLNEAANTSSTSFTKAPSKPVGAKTDAVPAIPLPSPRRPVVAPLGAGNGHDTRNGNGRGGYPHVPPNSIKMGERRGVGKRLTELRIAKGLSQRELGIKCGYQQSIISRIEIGKKEPCPEMVGRLARALNVTEQELEVSSV